MHLVHDMVQFIKDKFKVIYLLNTDKKTDINDSYIRNSCKYIKVMQGNVENIFEERPSQTDNEHPTMNNFQYAGMPYLKKGDSQLYVDQFLAKTEDKIQVPKIQNVNNLENSPSKHSSSSDQDFKMEDHSKNSSSSFHNFQKHLTVCLRNSVQIKLDKQNVQDYEIAALRLWKAFKQSNCTTKKILHYIFCQQNEHRIQESSLREYNLHKIYSSLSDETIVKARKYLANETIRQIKSGKVMKYINDKKLKDKTRFIKYVQFFTNELQQGYLRKRLPKDKVNELANL